MVSEAQKEANRKYKKNTYDRVTMLIRKDSDLTLAMIKEHAASQGESFRAFVRRAVAETMTRDIENEQHEYKGGED